LADRREDDAGILWLAMIRSGLEVGAGEKLRGVGMSSFRAVRCSSFAWPLDEMPSAAFIADLLSFVSRYTGGGAGEKLKGTVCLSQPVASDAWA